MVLKSATPVGRSPEEKEREQLHTKIKLYLSRLDKLGEIPEDVNEKWKQVILKKDSHGREGLGKLGELCTLFDDKIYSRFFKKYSEEGNYLALILLRALVYTSDQEFDDKEGTKIVTRTLFQMISNKSGFIAQLEQAKHEVDEITERTREKMGATPKRVEEPKIVVKIDPKTDEFTASGIIDKIQSLVTRTKLSEELLQSYKDQLVQIGELKGFASFTFETKKKHEQTLSLVRKAILGTFQPQGEVSQAGMTDAYAWMANYLEGTSDAYTKSYVAQQLDISSYADVFETMSSSLISNGVYDRSAEVDRVTFDTFVRLHALDPNLARYYMRSIVPHFAELCRGNSTLFVSALNQIGTSLESRIPKLKEIADLGLAKQGTVDSISKSFDELLRIDRSAFILHTRKETTEELVWQSQYPPYHYLLRVPQEFFGERYVGQMFGSPFMPPALPYGFANPNQRRIFMSMGNLTQTSQGGSMVLPNLRTATIQGYTSSQQSAILSYIHPIVGAGRIPGTIPGSMITEPNKSRLMKEIRKAFISEERQYAGGFAGFKGASGFSYGETSGMSGAGVFEALTGRMYDITTPEGKKLYALDGDVVRYKGKEYKVGEAEEYAIPDMDGVPKEKFKKGEEITIKGVIYTIQGFKPRKVAVRELKRTLEQGGTDVVQTKPVYVLLKEKGASPLVKSREVPADLYYTVELTGKEDGSKIKMRAQEVMLGKGGYSLGVGGTETSSGIKVFGAGLIQAVKIGKVDVHKAGTSVEFNEYGLSEEARKTLVEYAASGYFTSYETEQGGSPVEYGFYVIGAKGEDKEERLKAEIFIENKKTGELYRVFGGYDTIQPFFNCVGASMEQVAKQDVDIGFTAITPAWLADEFADGESSYAKDLRALEKSAEDHVQGDSLYQSLASGIEGQQEILQTSQETLTDLQQTTIQISEIYQRLTELGSIPRTQGIPGVSDPVNSAILAETQVLEKQLVDLRQFISEKTGEHYSVVYADQSNLGNYLTAVKSLAQESLVVVSQSMQGYSAKVVDSQSKITVLSTNLDTRREALLSQYVDSESGKAYAERRKELLDRFKELYGGGGYIAMDLGRGWASTLLATTTHDYSTGEREYVEAGTAISKTWQGDKWDTTVILIPTMAKGLEQREGYHVGTFETVVRPIRKIKKGEETKIPEAHEVRVIAGAGETPTTQEMSGIAGVSYRFQSKDAKTLGGATAAYYSPALFSRVYSVGQGYDETREQLEAMKTFYTRVYGQGQVGKEYILLGVADLLMQKKGAEPFPHERPLYLWNMMMTLKAIDDTFGISLSAKRFTGLMNALQNFNSVFSQMQNRPEVSGEILEQNYGATSGFQEQLSQLFQEYSLAATGKGTKADGFFELKFVADEQSEDWLRHAGWRGLVDLRKGFIRTSGTIPMSKQETELGYASIGGGVDLPLFNSKGTFSRIVADVYGLIDTEGDLAGWGVSGAVPLLDAAEAKRRELTELKTRISQEMKKSTRDIKSIEKLSEERLKLEEQYKELKLAGEQLYAFVSYLEASLPNEDGESGKIDRSSLTTGLIAQIKGGHQIYVIYNRSNGKIFLETNLTEQETRNHVYAGASVFGLQTGSGSIGLDAIMGVSFSDDFTGWGASGGLSLSYTLDNWTIRAYVMGMTEPVGALVPEGLRGSYMQYLYGGSEPYIQTGIEVLFHFGSGVKPQIHGPRSLQMTPYRTDDTSSGMTR